MSIFARKSGVLFCCLLLTLCLSACSAGGTLSLPAASAPQAQKPDPPTPEKAAELYLQNMDLWLKTPETATAYGYCLLDLDFDGAPELVASVCAGTGMYSENTVYKINPGSTAVNPVGNRLNRGEDPDYYYLNDRTKLLQNLETGKLFYLAEDYVRVGDREGADTFYEVYMEDGKLVEEVVFSESFAPDYANGTNTTVRSYSFRGESLSKVEYDKKLATYYSENIDRNGKWTVLDGEEFAAADSNAKKALLLAACRGFSTGEPLPDDPDGTSRPESSSKTETSAGPADASDTSGS